eukprot:TRINITY_DN9215_c0_g3_i1.p2 TRINITY_DN9215_c0_g3~~TRINITY_DN9215_c0_g3_i1.p2  ORF type:complete len:181 (+),score=23.22 TRINITY_DN9215_c0_g3_i1:961-1503(+)
MPEIGLCADLLVEVAAYLGYRDLATCGRVNVSFRKAVGHKRVLLNAIENTEGGSTVCHRLVARMKAVVVAGGVAGVLPPSKVYGFLVMTHKHRATSVALRSRQSVTNWPLSNTYPHDYISMIRAQIPPLQARLDTILSCLSLGVASFGPVAASLSPAPVLSAMWPDRIDVNSSKKKVTFP